MRKGLEGRLLEAAAPLLNPGEQPVFGTCATVGAGVNNIRNITRGAVQESVATLGTSFTLNMPKRFYLLLTNQRLLFVGSNDNTSRPVTQLAWQVPRAGLRLQPVSGGGLMKCYQVVAPDGRPLAQLNFAVPQRSDATHLAEVLNGM
ncbi:hypothetical protein [Actinocrispum sp. NPDC049592]|uniref:hypothetical protein n=1 Tax=Actinocrispum sp. NPDC049592 TaxID=3154835 RepID=UPI00342B9E47